MLRRTLLGLVLLYAALLRFDAVTLMHGPVETPSWFAGLQQTRADQSLLRPAGMTWPRWEGRYISDPYTYLQYAREPRGFYDAHRREPVFVFATKLSLWFFGDHDEAVSWASAAFSLAAVWLTFLVGRQIGGWAVGLLAALAFGVEMTVIGWAAGGWRDEAFTCAVALTAYVALRYRQSPTLANAAWLGAVGGVACLVRITSLSFVVPVFALMGFVAPGPWRARLRGVALATVLWAVVAGPFLFNCWRVYGDPLYAINVHADVYREAEGQVVQSSQTAREYLWAGLRSRPLATADTLLQGMTIYPFANKWDGFRVWHPVISEVLPWLAVAGLLWFLALPAGRVLLLVLVTSLLPYAPTWRLIGDWRFTVHAYPFFLIAAALVIVKVGLLVWPARRSAALARLRSWRLTPSVGMAAGAVVGGLLVFWWAIAIRLPEGLAREQLAIEQVTTITSGFRDRAFAGAGWQAPITRGNVTTRRSTADRGRVRLPVVRGAAWDLVIRLDPAPPPTGEAQQTLRVFLDGQPRGQWLMTWDPQRIGTYTVPMGTATRDWADIELVVEGADGAPASLRLWWMSVRLR